MPFFPGPTVIVDFGMGNLDSVRRKLSQFNRNPIVSSDPGAIVAAAKLVLPGVGHFLQAMENLKRLRLIEPLNEAVLIKRIPVLGICLGLQLMARHSQEGDVDGLGWIEGEVVRFRPSDTLKFKVPHVGWNQVSIRKESALMKGIPNSSEFYFVHSYHFMADAAEDILNEAVYEHTFTAAIERDNVFGVQYHPEKSHDIGERLLGNFANL